MQSLDSISQATAPPVPLFDDYLNDDDELEVQPNRFVWDRDAYYRLAELGILDGKRVELIEGEIIEMAPMGSSHITGISLAAELLREIFGNGYSIRTQAPIDISDNSQPEPDVAVVKGNPRDFAAAHPQSAVLVMEVSDSSISFDRNIKSRLYAQGRIEEYWILNLKNRCLEVYRKPVEDTNLGFIYAERTVFGETELVAPLAKPKAKIKVADILP